MPPSLTLMKITLEDIAKSTGYTKGLVSRALGGKYNVSDEARDRIVQKAAELGYDMHKLRSRKKSVKRVLLIISSKMLLKEDYWQPILKSISSNLDCSSIALEYLVYDENNIDDGTISKLTISEYGAYILIHSNPSAIVRELKKLSKPIILVDPKYYDSEGVTQIKFANYDSTFQATQELINMGHKCIAFYGSDAHSTSFRERHEGFYGCISRNKDIKGVSIDFNNQNNDYADNTLLIEQYYKHKFTAMLCANDIIAIGAMKALKRNGIRIPQDVSIVGFDNIKACEEISPTLTTFNVPRKALGTDIAKYIIGMFSEQQLQYSSIVIRSEYIKRESVIKRN